jgi:DNA topoisomerase I
MPRKGGWRREGSRGRFRYVDARGSRIVDEEKLERIKSLAIPPAWKEVWISAGASSKLQATGVDAAGRKQYIYHPNFRAQQEQAKFDRLIRFAERLPDLRTALSEHIDNERGKHGSAVRATLVDPELADAIKELLALPRRGCLFRYEWDGGLCALTGPKLNDYVRAYLGEEFTAKDFRTWGGTLIAAITLAERGPARTEADAKRAITAVMRTVGEQLGNTPAVARNSYVSPAVIDQYLDATTIEDFRPRHLRVVGARDLGLDREEQALLSLLRSWRIKHARAAA